MRLTAGWVRPVAGYSLVIALLALTLAPSPVLGDDSSVWDIVESISAATFFYAWPTATYERVSFGSVSPVAGGYNVSFRLHGRSGVNDGPLWVDVVVELRGGQIQDFHFGNNNAILAQPGQTMKSLGEALADLNQQAGTSSQATPLSGSVGGFDIYFTNGCNRPVRLALKYQAVTGDWQTLGWWSFGARESAFLVYDNRRLKTNSSVLYYFAESTDGSLIWRGDATTAYLDGKSLGMRKLHDKDGDTELSITCP